MRALLLLPLVACANLPDVRPCDNEGAVLDPAYVTVGTFDEMVVSMRWQGCPSYPFVLCGIGDDWVSQDLVKLGIWHDGTLDSCGDDEQLDDVFFNLQAVRNRYEKDYDVKSADLLLQIGTHEVEYSFSEDE